MKKDNFSEGNPRKISIMGSTGSIGTQTLDIIRAYPEKFKVAALTGCHNWELLARQALEFKPSVVVIADETYHQNLSEALKDSGIKVLAGHDSLSAASTLEEADLVVAALVGFSGLSSTIAALEAGKHVALANKETLVVAGEIIDSIVKKKGKKIIPIDSEHSAIFQCLWGEEHKSLSKIILTASGGPFRSLSKEQLQKVSLGQALKHPTWNMGMKVTIDSATMMNKGFEMIEAHWLFKVKPKNIEIVVHPESVVHSMVQFYDGSVKAQLGLPDMHVPISVALGYPQRLDLELDLNIAPLNLINIGRLTFEQPDFMKFPLLGLAYAAIENGGLAPALLNATNEVAVKAFIEGKITFNEINRLVLASFNAIKNNFKTTPVTIESIKAAHKEGTEIARENLNRINSI